ncbi:MAG: hypothetical protein K2X38_14925 [Gemmataceae bacterium]|nr:hypothetical protein [Gemmataceae bacterium]
MGKKQDIKDIEAIAKQFGMDEEARRDFGDFVEECKRQGEGGAKNDRGDFTWGELEGKAREFLGRN